jgi:hypothetical protein
MDSIHRRASKDAEHVKRDKSLMFMLLIVLFMRIAELGIGSRPFPWLRIDKILPHAHLLPSIYENDTSKRSIISVFGRLRKSLRGLKRHMIYLWLRNASLGFERSHFDGLLTKSVAGSRLFVGLAAICYLGRTLPRQCTPWVFIMLLPFF